MNFLTKNNNNQQVVNDIWICEKQTVTKWNGSIMDYKEHLKKNMLKEAR